MNKLKELREEFDGLFFDEFADGTDIWKWLVKNFVPKTPVEATRSTSYIGAGGAEFIKKEKNKIDSTAWCECGDELEHSWVDNGKGLKIDHEYYCFGCDQKYKLVKK